MKRNVLQILTVSSVITTIGYIMDGDPTEPSMAMRFIEFFATLAIVFLLVSALWFSIRFVLRKLRHA